MCLLFSILKARNAEKANVRKVNFSIDFLGKVISNSTKIRLLLIMTFVQGLFYQRGPQRALEAHSGGACIYKGTNCNA